MAKNTIIEHVLSTSSNRRSLLKKLAFAGAAIEASQLPQAGTAFGASRVRQSAQVPSAVDVVQFALNLEYLEAEFYSIATTGQNLQQRGVPVTGVGTPGPTTTRYGKVNMGDNIVLTAASARDIAEDEIGHVKTLRAALAANGITPVAKPAIDLDALTSKGASLADQRSFLLLARAFEDTGVSAFNGGAPLLCGSPYMMTAARILAVEGEHAGNIRLEVARLGIQTQPLDPADLIPPPSGSSFYSSNRPNGLTAFRTPGQVLYIVYGFIANATSGGFFPNGLNGAINKSSGPATSANVS